MLPREAPKFVS